MATSYVEEKKLSKPYSGSPTSYSASSLAADSYSYGRKTQSQLGISIPTGCTAVISGYRTNHTALESYQLFPTTTYAICVHNNSGDDLSGKTCYLRLSFLDNRFIYSP